MLLLLPINETSERPLRSAIEVPSAQRLVAGSSNVKTLSLLILATAEREDLAGLHVAVETERRVGQVRPVTSLAGAKFDGVVLRVGGDDETAVCGGFAPLADDGGAAVPGAEGRVAALGGGLACEGGEVDEDDLGGAGGSLVLVDPGAGRLAEMSYQYLV